MIRTRERRPRRAAAAEAVARPPSAWFAALVAADAAGAGAALLLPYTLATAADRLLDGRPATTATLAVAALLGVGVLADMAGSVASAACTGRAIARARRRLLASILGLGVAGRDRFAAGDLISRLVGNCADAGAAPVALASTLIALATSAVSAAALWCLDPWLGAAFLIGLVPVLLLVRVFMRQTAELLAQYQEIQGRISARLADALAGIRTIRACGTADREIERILAPLPELAETGRRTWYAQRSIVWRISLLAPAIEVVMLTVAGFAIAAGRIPPGDLLATAGYTTLALGFIGQVDSLVQLVHSRAGAQRVGEVCAAAADLPDGGGREPVPGPGRVQLRGVTVRADGGRTVLDRVDLDVPAGSTVVLVGASGSGKSTLARLVGRLTEPDEGQVLLDGAPVSGLDVRALRHQVAYAFERPELLGATVHEAIAYAVPEATRETAVQAAELACADVFIRRLPHGYDTSLHDLALSGGEAQRLGLARALAQDARVLVLDDATSSLDTLTEMQISRALTGALTGRTRLVVAQRIATAQRADLVAWLDRGRLRATGSHEQLWQDPDYRAVFSGSEAR